ETVWPFLAFAMGLASPLLVCQGVILAGDDVLYARLASEMADGHPMFGINTHTYRLGFLVPLAALYRAFGIHDWTIIAFPLLSSLSTVLRSEERRVGKECRSWVDAEHYRRIGT